MNTENVPLYTDPQGRLIAASVRVAPKRSKASPVGIWVTAEPRNIALITVAMSAGE